MIWHIGVHGTNDTALIDHLGDIRKRLADMDPTSSVTLKGKGGWHEPGGLGLLVEIPRRLCALKARKGRLGIEGIDVRGPSIHEQENHPLGTRSVRLMQARSGGGMSTGQHASQTQKAKT